MNGLLAGGEIGRFEKSWGGRSTINFLLCFSPLYRSRFIFPARGRNRDRRRARTRRIDREREGATRLPLVCPLVLSLARPLSSPTVIYTLTFKHTLALTYPLANEPPFDHGESSSIRSIRPFLSHGSIPF